MTASLAATIQACFRARCTSWAAAI
jgi:hypothetical protein